VIYIKNISGRLKCTTFEPKKRSWIFGVNEPPRQSVIGQSKCTGCGRL